jgi:hypothetical protein
VSVPAFPEFRPVGLEDREVIKDHLDREHPGTCELNFANIFIWRKSEHPRLTLINGNLCILVEPDFDPPYFLPPAGTSRLVETVETCLTVAPRLSRVPEEFVRKLRGAFAAVEDPDNFDYVFLREDLAELRGKKFDGKRNRIRKFESTYAHAYETLGEARVDDCRLLLESWFRGKGNSEPFLKAEKEAIHEALSFHGPLGLRGGVAIVDGRVEAFTIGMRLTDDTALVQIEIANPDVVGVAQWINREFVRREWSGFRFVNREQDMGHPGVRRAKLSYQPFRLVKKFNVTRMGAAARHDPGSPE